MESKRKFVCNFISKSGVKNPSVSEIVATEVYVTGYYCKGNQGTGALSDLFHDIVNSADDNAGIAKSCVTIILMNTVKRDISAVEASFELSVGPITIIQIKSHIPKHDFLKRMVHLYCN